MGKILLLFINFVLAIGLFFINSLLGNFQYKYREHYFEYGKFSFGDVGGSFEGNFFQKIVNPTIYTAILAAIFQHYFDLCLAKSLWMIGICYWLLRGLYILFKNLFIFVNWKYEISSLVLSLMLCEGVFFLVILPLINDGKTVMIPASELRNAVWLAIFAYLVKITWDISKSKFEFSAVYPEEKREKIVIKKYEKFAKKYGTLILESAKEEYKEEDGFRQFLCLIYAIAIYEEYNRPVLFRFVENTLMILSIKGKMTLGVMQVETEKLISNEESIKVAIKKIANSYITASEANEDPFEKATWDYNQSENYEHEVFYIFNVLNDRLPYGIITQVISNV